MSLLKQVGCALHGTFDRLTVQLYEGGAVMVGAPTAYTNQIGWVVLDLSSIDGEIIDVECVEGTDPEPVLIVTTAQSRYQAFGYLEGLRQPQWVLLHDTTPITATS